MAFWVEGTACAKALWLEGNTAALRQNEEHKWRLPDHLVTLFAVLFVAIYVWPQIRNKMSPESEIWIH